MDGRRVVLGTDGGRGEAVALRRGQGRRRLVVAMLLGGRLLGVLGPRGRLLVLMLVLLLLELSADMS